MAKYNAFRVLTPAGRRQRAKEMFARGRTLKEIAARFGIQEKTAAKYLFNASTQQIDREVTLSRQGSKPSLRTHKRKGTKALMRKAMEKILEKAGRQYGKRFARFEHGKLLRLAERFRLGKAEEAVMFAMLAGIPVGEIAEALNISEAQVRKIAGAWRKRSSGQP